MDTCKLTIFTPAYNRSACMKRLYKSLVDQTCHNFRWIIVDDGSTDDLGQLAAQWIHEEEAFSISYYYKKNGGMYTAYNTALSHVDTEYWVCVDSDDWMPADAVEKIYAAFSACERSGAAGIVGLDALADGRVLGGLFPKEACPLCHLIDIQLKIRHAGDMKMVYRKEISDRIGFMPEIEGEKDFNPYYMMLQMDRIAPLLVLNEILCYVEYQSDGMTHNVWKAYKRSPISYGLLRLEFLDRENLPFFFSCKQCIHYVSSWLFTVEKREKRGMLPLPLQGPLMIAAWIPGIVLHMITHIKNR